MRKPFFVNVLLVEVLTPSDAASAASSVPPAGISLHMNLQHTALANAYVHLHHLQPPIQRLRRIIHGCSHNFCACTCSSIFSA